MKRKWNLILAFVVAVASLFGVGTSLGASEPDEQIESSFKTSYTYRKCLKDDSVGIKAEEGVVTLTGTVKDEPHKILAQETAANLSGVTSVDNRLTTLTEAPDKNADIWIGRKVKLALMFHRHVSYTTTTVEVKDGIVTLTGEARSMAQKELTTEYTRDIDGVKGVKNDMTVAAIPEQAERTVSEKMDDASITAQVKTALAIHRSTKSIDTKIITRDGEVTATGIAKNEAEKALVTKLVSDIRGVTSVKNQLTVEEAKSK